jgi:23S rRNA pseudouridine1911/1915/1917 synthase
MSLTNNPKILYEDEALLVLNKPSGMVANISRTSPHDTLQHFLIDKLNLPGEPQSAKDEFVSRSGLVHRLDKDTSGVLLAAKDEETFYALKKQFVQRKVHKIYLAAVWGEMRDELFKINAPIKRDPRNRMRMAIVSDGRRALTNGRLLKTWVEKEIILSLVELIPETGRTHQLRVHMAALKHPIVGDQIYMTKKQLAECGKLFQRLMLHAWKISFYHPKDKKEVKFVAPLPPQFVKMYSKPE